MEFLISFAISFAIETVSTVIKHKMAEDRREEVEKLNEQRLNLQRESLAIEKTEKERLIHIQRRKQIATRRSTAAVQGQDVEGRASSTNLQDVAIKSSAKGAESLLEKRTGSTLALNINAYELNKAQSATAGLAEQLFTSGLDVSAGVYSSIGAIELKEEYSSK
jgi:hypothetical protein